MTSRDYFDWIEHEAKQHELFEGIAHDARMREAPVPDNTSTVIGGDRGILAEAFPPPEETTEFHGSENERK